MAGMCRITFDDPERDTRVVAYAGRYAADRHGELFFLSIGGESMAVRAVLAALASRRSVTMEGSTQHSWLMFPWNAQVKFKTVRLPSGLAHGIAWNEDRSNGIFVQDMTPESVYRAVYDRFPVTLLPEWAGWFTKRLRQQEWLVDLDGVGMKAGVIRATTGELDRLVGEGVKRGEIRIVAASKAA